MASSEPEFLPDGPEARRIASVIPYYPFHGVPRFYDISGMTQDPTTLKLCIEGFRRRYSAPLLKPDFIAGLDARGFIIGPPLAMALDLPFIMLRKKGKLPNSITGSSYRKEYNGDDPTGGDSLCMSRTAFESFVPGESGPKPKVLIVDDLVATGGTLIAACDLVEGCGGEVIECACVVELKALKGFEKVRAKHEEVKVWSLISEDILTLEGNTEEGGEDK